MAPPTAGLRLWLDAADAATLTVADGKVTQWKDKSPDGRAAMPRGPGAAAVAAGALGGLPVVRLAGGTAFDVPEIRPAAGPAAVFAVVQRLPEQASDAQWQRVLSVPGPESDTKAPGFCMTGDAKGTGKEFAATIMSTSNQSVVLAALAIGGQRKGNGQFLKGDIAEVLIYDRTFLTWDESHQVIEYLSTKWGIALGAEDRNWTRAGPLGDLPQRTSDVLPLSDQANAGGWVRYDAMWDEFDGPALDAAKWRPSLPWWQGRPPAWFDPKNVAVQESCLTLTMKKDNPPEMPKDGGYKDYTSAIVSSLTSVLYGYFEVRAKPMRSAGSSSFWFQCAPEDKPKDFKEMVCGNEIDVYEMGGGAPGYEQKYNMNAHATRPKGGGTCESFGCGGCWVAPFKLADDFHVYALEWDDKWMTYYVDGVVVRKAENQCWHFPQRMIFDSETMPTWLGMPKDEDLPSTYYVDYVRAWKKP